jgi:hypothetical protein
MTRYKYPYDRYNRFDVLRVNLRTIAAVLFLTRHMLTFLIIGLAFSRMPPDSRSAFGGLFEPVFMAADIPALLVFLAMLARHPKSGRLARIVWRGGPWLLLASAGLYLGLLLREPAVVAAPHGWTYWAMIAGTALSVGYVFFSPYARDLFRQFPDPGLADDDGKT